MGYTGAPPIKITADLLFEETISPLIYGDFVEFLNDIIPGMRAEKVQDRSFEGVLQPLYVWPQDTRWSAVHWTAFVAGLPHLSDWPADPAQFDMAPVTAHLTLDPQQPFVGRQSARVTVDAPLIEQRYVAGLAQGGIAVRAGQRLTVELYARASAADGEDLTVLLGRNYGVFFRPYASLRFGGLNGEWQRLQGTLVPEVSDDEATLAIGVGRAGTFWVDKVSLLPGDAQQGWRPDVVAAVRAMKPGIIRFGGSSLIHYQWETGIGPRERRVPFVNEPWGNREEHDVGLHEFLEFCELVDAVPLICVNSNSTTVDQLLAEIDYCNGPATSPYGRLRAEMGHPAPFGVTYWQIGNEQAGEDYERVLGEYARAIRAHHPHLVVLASYPSDRILGDLSRDLDYICPHFYAPYSREREDELRYLIARIRRESGNPALKIGITEWNHTAGHWGWARAWLQTQFNALNAARMFNMFQRLGDVVRIANRSNLTNSVFSGVLQTNRTGLHLAPAYYVQAAYANLTGGHALRVVATPSEVLDVAATRRTAGDELAVCAVNYLAEPQTRVLDLTAQRVTAGPVRAWTLASASLDAMNNDVEKERIAPREQDVANQGDHLAYTFPPYSVTILCLPLHPVPVR
jgi:alpha-L-arabinofuranosidase